MVVLDVALHGVILLAVVDARSVVDATFVTWAYVVTVTALNRSNQRVVGNRTLANHEAAIGFDVNHHAFAKRRKRRNRDRLVWVHVGHWCRTKRVQRCRREDFVRMSELATYRAIRHPVLQHARAREVAREHRATDAILASCACGCAARCVVAYREVAVKHAVYGVRASGTGHLIVKGHPKPAKQCIGSSPHPPDYPRSAGCPTRKSCR